MPWFPGPCCDVEKTFLRVVKRTTTIPRAGGSIWLATTMQVGVMRILITFFPWLIRQLFLHFASDLFMDFFD